MGHDAARSLGDELPAHGRWVQRLARSLVRDEASAADLAQEAQLAALRRGPSMRGALAPWLARVTRNLARRGWRDEARRAARERAVARPEAMPGADESAARLEMQRRLVDELAALEPAVRHALVRRYLDGWTAARIARETGEPAATVRWRLQRGLAELRIRLDRRSGGDGVAWRLALLPCLGKLPWTGWSGRLRPSASSATIQGALTMKAASQALIAGVMAAAVGLGAWWTLGRRDGPAAAVDVEPRSPLATRETAQEPAEVLAPSFEPTREAIRVGPSPERDESPLVAAPLAPRVEGRCVDGRIVPIASARLSQVGEQRSTSSRADGSFALEVASNGWNDCTLRVEAEGFATLFLETTLSTGGATNLGDVVLEPGGSLRGRVLGPGRIPFAGATIAVTGPDLWGSLEEARVSGPSAEHMLTGTSGVDGRFQIDGVGTGPMRAWAGAEGMRYAVSTPIKVRARQATDEVELVLEPIRTDDRITGVVLSPGGEPVPGASIQCMERWGGGMTSYFVNADSSGLFEIAAKRSRSYDLSAHDDRWTPSQVRGVAPGTHDVELVFVEARWIEVRARAADGEPVEEYDLRALEEGGGFLDSARAEPRPGGSGRLRAPSGPFLVCVDARGFAPSTKGPFLPESAPQALDFELSPEPGLRGRVLADGEPVTDAKVTLHRANAQEHIEHDGYPCLAAPDPDDGTVTDAEGRFVLRLRERGAYLVRAEASGRAATDIGPLELSPEKGRTDLELVLGKGGALEGRVLVALGRDPAGVIVAMNRGDAFPRTVRSDAEGRFHFEGLSAGRWHLSRGAMEVNPKGGGTALSIAKTPTVIPFNCTIREGETTHQDLDLRDFEPCELAGVLYVNGSPSGNWGVMAWPGAKDAMVGTPPSSATAADGSFTLSIDEAGLVRLSFSPPAELGGQGRIDALTEVHPGANAWREEFSMGRLTGRCISSVPPDERALFYCSAEGVTPSCWLPIFPDENGRFVLPFVPAGKGAVRCMTKEMDWSWSTLLETEIPARGERVLDLP